MDIQEIRQRLKDLGISRAEFAERIGVSKQTLDTWLSGCRAISKQRMNVIEYVLAHCNGGEQEKVEEVLSVAETEDEPKSQPRVRYVVAPLTEGEFAIMLRAAAILGMSENEFAHHALLSESENVIDMTKITGQKSV